MKPFIVELPRPTDATSYKAAVREAIASYMESVGGQLLGDPVFYATNGKWRALVAWGALMTIELSVEHPPLYTQEGT